MYGLFSFQLSIKSPNFRASSSWYKCVKLWGNWTFSEYIFSKNNPVVPHLQGLKEVYSKYPPNTEKLLIITDKWTSIPWFHKDHILFLNGLDLFWIGRHLLRHSTMVFDLHYIGYGRRFKSLNAKNKAFWVKYKFKSKYRSPKTRIINRNNGDRYSRHFLIHDIPPTFNPNI